MRSIAQIMRSNGRWEILGGRTLAENAAYWQERWAKGEGIIWPFGKKERDAPASPHNDETFENPVSLQEHLSNCAVPPRIAELAAKVAAGELQPRAATLAVRSWVESDESFLLLHGDSGGGKSVAAAGVFEAAHQTIRWNGGAERRWVPHDCWFLEAPQVARQSYFDEEGRALVKHVKRVRLLVLDDLGQELLSQPYLATIDEVLCERFADKRKRTVITTNVSAKRPGTDKPSPFEERYGARIARRIRESGRVVHVHNDETRVTQ